MSKEKEVVEKTTEALPVVKDKVTIKTPDKKVKLDPFVRYGEDPSKAGKLITSSSYDCELVEQGVKLPWEMTRDNWYVNTGCYISRYLNIGNLSTQDLGEGVIFDKYVLTDKSNPDDKVTIYKCPMSTIEYGNFEHEYIFKSITREPIVEKILVVVEGNVKVSNVNGRCFVKGSKIEVSKLTDTVILNTEKLRIRLTSEIKASKIENSLLKDIHSVDVYYLDNCQVFESNVVNENGSYTDCVIARSNIYAGAHSSDLRNVSFNESNITSRGMHGSSSHRIDIEKYTIRCAGVLSIKSKFDIGKFTYGQKKLSYATIEPGSENKDASYNDLNLFSQSEATPTTIVISSNEIGLNNVVVSETDLTNRRLHELLGEILPGEFTSNKNIVLDDSGDQLTNLFKDDLINQIISRVKVIRCIQSANKFS